VTTYKGLAGLYIGSYEEAWPQAVALSSRMHIRTVAHPFKRVLSVMPEMYDDIWTAAKGMYKLEPVVADGGEVVIYAPHITEISYTHGRILDEIGYHVRDYFVKQWERFQGYPWGVLHIPPHLRGGGIRCGDGRGVPSRPGDAGDRDPPRALRAAGFRLPRSGGGGCGGLDGPGGRGSPGGAPRR
jgi:hypothetical protein